MRWNKLRTGLQKGSPAFILAMSFLSLDVATIFIAFVIFCMFLMERMRMLSVFNVAAFLLCTS